MRPFNNDEIELMSDITIPHKELAAQFDVGETAIRDYRQQQLGIYMRGFNYQYSDLKDKVDWTKSTLEIARELKVSVAAVVYWRRLTAAAQRKLGKLTPSQRAEILKSNESSELLARRFQVTGSTIRHLWRTKGQTRKTGPKQKTCKDFPNTNWKQPAMRLSKELGVSWVVADRLRTEALNVDSCEPVIDYQLLLPGFANESLLPSSLECVDWTENASFLTAYLKLDKPEVLRLKLVAQAQRRRK